MIAVASLAGVAAGELQAQTTCVPPAAGVPFAPGPPKWWDPAADPTPGRELYQRIDDPRWRGSVRIGDGGDGTVEQLAFRALHHTEGSARSLYLSWWVRVAPIAASDDNVLYLGLSDGSEHLLLKVRLGSNDTQATQPPEENVQVFPVAVTGGLGAEIADDPPWTDNIRVWAGDTPYPQNWAIHVNVPLNEDLGNNVELPDDADFRLWYEILQGTPGDPVAAYTWPYSRGGDNSNKVKPDPTVPAGERLPAVSRWLPFQVSSGAGDPDCPTGGVAIYAMDIGTTHPDGAGKVSLNSPNTFYARPWNFSGDLTPVGHVHARFRIANWGSNPADPNISSGQLWMDVRGLEDVTQNPPPADIDDGSQWGIQDVWTLNQAERDLFQNGERWIHQCILVELSGPVRFSKSSAYRNMRFVDTSRFTEDAQISLFGLEPVAGGGTNRDVYLYVQTTNMPKVAFPSWKVGQVAAEAATPVRSRPASTRARAPAIASRDSLDDRDAPLHERLAMTQPTYLVHAYYDTGDRFTVNGVSRPVLQPMTSFGYFARHDGPVEGWRHELTSPDAQLEELGPDFYKLSVPNDGAVTVTNIIEAIEPKRYGISLHAGVSIPHGSFGDAYDVGYGAMADLEYRLTSSLSVEAISGYHEFGSRAGGADQKLIQGALNAKYYFLTSALRPYVIAGGGGYRFDPGSEEAGTNAGTGLQWNLSPGVALGLDYTFHAAYTGGATTTFSAVQAGGRVRF